MKTLNKKILNVINRWDPLELFPIAPEDEYCEEIKKIQKYIENSNELSTEKLAVKINEIFGEDDFSKSLEECRAVANQMLF